MRLAATLLTLALAGCSTPPPSDSYVAPDPPPPLVQPDEDTLRKIAYVTASISWIERNLRAAKPTAAQSDEAKAFISLARTVLDLSLAQCLEGRNDEALQSARRAESLLVHAQHAFRR